MTYMQSRLEENVNAATHGLMAVIVVLAMPFAVLGAWQSVPAASRTAAFSVAVFCLSMILMFGSSTIYHYLPATSRRKQIFHRMDHISIYFAIAGTCTPIALIAIGGSAGRSLLILEWSLVLAGIIFKVFLFQKSRLTEIISTAVYLMMGWAVVIWFPSFVANARPGCVILIVAGGICYTVGVVFFALNKKYAHNIWHIFVNAGAACHFLAIILFAG